MEIVCPNCKSLIKLPQKYPYHAGFSNVGFLYCDTNPGIFKFGSYNSHYIRIIGDKHPWTLTEAEKVKLEDHLAPCPCGGRFRFSAYPRCPSCNEDISSLLPDKIHFLEIGDVIDGDKNEKAWLANTIG